MMFNDFGSYFMLVGMSCSKQENGKEKIYLHFLFQLKNGSGYGCFRTSSEKERLFKMLPEKDFHLGAVYNVVTDKFLNEKKELITFLKDINLVREKA